MLLFNRGMSHKFNFASAIIIAQVGMYAFIERTYGPCFWDIILKSMVQSMDFGNQFSNIYMLKYQFTAILTIYRSYYSLFLMHKIQVTKVERDKLKPKFSPS